MVVSLDPHSICLLLKSPPARKLSPSVRKKVSKWGAFRLCLGGQYTAAVVMSRSGPWTCIDMAWISASSCFNCVWYAIVDFTRIAVPPWAVPSGWLVEQRSYLGMVKWVLDVKCVSLTSKICMWLWVRDSLTSSLCLWRPLAFQWAMRNILWDLMLFIE